MSDKLLDRGIYQTPYGFRVFLRIHGKAHTKRFPPTYTLEKLQGWRDDHLKLHKKKKTRGTFAADVEDYLKAVAAMPTFSDRKRQIEAWLPAFGDKARWQITPELIRQQLAAWRVGNVTTGQRALAPNTCNHRRVALGHLFRVIDGKNSYNPVLEVPPFKLPPPIKRGVPMDVVVRVLRKIRGRKTRARLEVLAWTGLRPSELMRLTEDHIDLRRKTALIPTAKGGPAREIGFAKALPAWKRLVKAEALGPFSVQSTRKSLVRACKALNITPFRVYDLRHSFLSALRESGADLSDVQAQAGHSDIRLTRRYAPTVTEKLRRAVAKVSSLSHQSARKFKKSQKR